MTSINATTISLRDHTWDRLKLLAEATGCHQSYILQKLCDDFLPQFETRLPGTVLDDSTPAGRFERLKVKAQDEHNLKAPLNAAENIPGMLGDHEYPLTGLKIPIPRESLPQAVAVMLARGTPEQQAEALAYVSRMVGGLKVGEMGTILAPSSEGKTVSMFSPAPLPVVHSNLGTVLHAEDNDDDEPGEEDGPWAAGWLFRSGKAQVGSFVRLFGDKRFIKGCMEYNHAVLVSIDPPALVDCGGSVCWKGDAVLAMRLVTVDLSKFGYEWVSECRRLAMAKWKQENTLLPAEKTLPAPEHTSEAFKAGWRCRTGECALTNPYTLMTKEYAEWREGYDFAHQAIQRRKQAIRETSDAVERELTGNVPVLPHPTLTGEDDPNGVQ